MKTTIIKKTSFYIIGGVGVATITLFVNLFFQSPPTRAEFDTFKITTEINYEYIKESLSELKEGQKEIKEDIKQWIN